MIDIWGKGMLTFRLAEFVRLICHNFLLYMAGLLYHKHWIGVENIQEIAAAGADTFVAGSAIFSQSNYKKVIDEMRSELSAVS